MAKRTLGTTKNPKNVAVNLRMPVGMATAILDVIDKHPIEFSTAADYMRFCIKQDLIKRKMI